MHDKAASSRCCQCAPPPHPARQCATIHLNRDEDRAVYLKLLRENIEACNVYLLGYCLMSNHVHLIAVPTLPDGLALACRNAHGRHAAYWNAMHGASGHAWQGRFYSCPLDEVHLWAALRYTELNPVRAGLVSQPECWPWSSAGVHKPEPEPVTRKIQGFKWTSIDFLGRRRRCSVRLAPHGSLTPTADDGPRCKESKSQCRKQ